MKNNDNFDFTNPEDSAWSNFVRTGDINYYLLYKRLVERKK